MRLLSAQIKIHQILVRFETINQFFFTFCINLQCHETQLRCTFLAEILYTFNERTQSRYKFGEIEYLKLGTLMGSLRQNNIKFQLKKTRRVISHERSLKKKWVVVSNMTWRILWILTQPPKVPKFYFNVLFLCKVSEVWAKKIRRSYLSWHWTVMQSLNKPWSCGFKNDMRNWVNFHYSTQKSEKLYTDGLFLSRWYNVSAKKFHRDLCVMTLKGNAKFKGKATCGLKNDIRNLVNFRASR